MATLHERIAEFCRENPEISLREVAKTLGVTREYVNKITLKAGLVRRSRLTDADVSKLEQLAQANATNELPEQR